jgi:Cu/Ag efflux protein CusF
MDPEPDLFSPGLLLVGGRRRNLMKLSKIIWASAVISLVSTAALAQQASGTVTKVDEQKGTISIQLTQGGTVGTGSGAVLTQGATVGVDSGGAVQEFKAQDPSMFKELRPGDKVLFRVFESNGTKTITRLDKE